MISQDHKHAVVYTVKDLVSRKRCSVSLQMLSLHTTDRMWYITPIV